MPEVSLEILTRRHPHKNRGRDIRSSVSTAYRKDTLQPTVLENQPYCATQTQSLLRRAKCGDKSGKVEGKFVPEIVLDTG